ncbi:MAG: hypothetical protein KTR29_12205 [Rhodothermaceae bacterium]|nr:hypothetical protein [Rhodothermaceae bacterium]
MNRLTTLLLVSVVLSQLGCASTSSQDEMNTFSFMYDNQEYSIVSIKIPPDDPTNYLLLREQNTFILRARDNNLDGVLDTLLVGNVSLDQANEIYSHGLSQAINKGRYNRYEPSRIYALQVEEGSHAIQSYEQPIGTWNNRFIIYNSDNEIEVSIRDQKADGTLDHIEKGQQDLQSSQPLYDNLLEAGIQQGRIANVNGVFVVSKL